MPPTVPARLVTPKLVNVTPPVAALTPICPTVPARLVTPLLAIVNVSVVAFVVNVIPALPAATVRVSSKLSATIFDWPLTAIVLKLVSAGFLINSPATVVPAGKFTTPARSAVICAEPRYKLDPAR